MNNVLNFIKQTFNTKEFIPLHEPRFNGNEKKYLNDCIDSTFVSSVGKYVDSFEKEFAKKIGSKYAVATVNGTAALHIALLLANVSKDDEVITQPLTFIATCNAISYIGASPIFIDVDLDTMGLSPKALQDFLENNCELKEKECINKATGKVIKACVPMHTFGHSCRIDEIVEICEKWNITVVEDSAESLGSFYKNKHTGTFGKVSAFSFNGNKTITSGGGGVIVTDDEELAKKAKHITTTAKVPHPYEYVHDQVGYNYRMPNINAALLVAQLEQLDTFLESKRDLASLYKEFFKDYDSIEFIEEPKDSISNYWLQAVKFETLEQRDEFLKFTNKQGVMTRPIWKLMSELDMFKDCQKGDLRNAKYLEERIVNIPSSVRVKKEEKLKNIIIVGAGGFSKELYSYINNEIENGTLKNYKIKGFLDVDKDSFSKMNIKSTYLGSEDNYKVENADYFLVAVGNINLRKKIISKLKNINANFFTYIHESVVLASDSKIGEGVIICPNCIVQPNTIISDHCVINIFSSIGHDSKIGENSILSPYCTLNGNVSAGKNLFMGTRSTILLGTDVGNNCTISANTVVKDSVEDGFIIQDKTKQIKVKNRLI